MTSEALAPATPEEAVEAVRRAAETGTTLEIVGAGTKRGFGRPLQAERMLDVGKLSGILLYEPEELVLSALAGTPIAEIEATLAERGQMLAFEPPDLGPLYGEEAGRATLGGIIACNLSGPRRLKAGAARDHLLGLEAISGRGEAFKTGGRVVKNVTGYDLCKLMTGSFGTLSVFTRLTVKVLPAPEKARTLLVRGLAPSVAVRAMGTALASPHEVSGAAYWPAGPAARSAVPYVSSGAASVTAIRVDGFAPSVLHRHERLKELLWSFGGRQEELHTRNTGVFWREVRDLLPFQPAGGRGDHAVWRVSVAPTEGARVAERIAAEAGPQEAEVLLDWAGGLLWLALPAGEDAGAAAVRGAFAGIGGHATLIRAPAAIRAAVPVFEPQPEALAALGRRVKESFDPMHILNRGRIVAEG